MDIWKRQGAMSYVHMVLDERRGIRPTEVLHGSQDSEYWKGGSFRLSIKKQQESMKSKRVNPPYRPYYQGNPSRVIFRHGTQFFRGHCYPTHVKWIFSRKMVMRVKSLGLST